jgi:hypothetical protein
VVLSQAFEDSHQIVDGTNIIETYISIPFHFARGSLAQICWPLLIFSPVRLLFGGNRENVVDSLSGGR